MGLTDLIFFPSTHNFVSALIPACHLLINFLLRLCQVFPLAPQLLCDLADFPLGVALLD